MPLIGLIHPNSILVERAIAVAANLGLSQSLVTKVGTVEKAGSIAKEFEAAGVDVIITRGMLVDIIKNAIDTPLVEIPVTGQDLATALDEAKKHTALERPYIALMAFSPMIKRDVEVFSELLNIDLVTYPVTEDIEIIKMQLYRAQQDGAHVVVAGHVSGGIATELGMDHLMLDSGEVALRTALLEAETVAYARNIEKSRTKRLQSVVDVSDNGILVVDVHGNIQAINTAARQLLHLNTKELYEAKDCLPEQIKHLCTEYEDQIKDDLVEINGMPILVSTDIVKIKNSTTDIIITLQPAAVIGELESKIRKSLHTRGLTSHYSFKDIWGESDSILTTIALARSYAATDSPILLMGETGTGKELFAQAIHQGSPCASGPFVAINCAALPPSLLESELFGHEEGAFTGAKKKGKPGLFEMANNGTIFLDEVSEMDHYGQTRLLRVLQERCIMRIGGDKYIPVNARIIAASNADLPALIREGGFRKDLYYRLNTLPLRIPPLRFRAGDIGHLARRLADRFKKRYGGDLRLTSSIIDVLEKHDWPGNVRELSGFVERLCIISRNTTVTEAEVQSMLTPETLSQEAFTLPKLGGEGANNPERQKIISTLKLNNGHQGQTAKQLGIHRSTLQRKIKKLNINIRHLPI